MKLRERLVFTFVVTALILVAPTMYGLFALRELRQVAYNLSTRDAVGALSLGRLQAAFEEAESRERIYLALAGTSAPDDRETARLRVEQSIASIDAELDRLRAGGYRVPAAGAVAAWEHLLAAIAEEQRLVESGDVQAADAYRDEVVNEAFEDMDRALDPIGAAINRAGAEQVAQARDIATRAATTTLVALTAALIVALAIGGWAGRSLLRPIRQLRRGMSAVAAGNFEPDLDIDPTRGDEIGDLARSFRRMTEQLAALRKLEAEFVSVASHELKTPLSVIKGYVTLLRDGIYGEVPESHVKILGSIDDQADRLARLIQRLLDISRFEAGGGRLEIQTVALRPFLADLATSFEALAFQNEIDFRLEVDDSLPEQMEGDPDRLNEVVGNLLSNAFKFTPRHGEIRLRARRAEAEAGEGVTIEVVDTGVGIPEDKLPRVFEKFFQVENEAQPRSVGSGLGLAISREIVEGHGGTIGAESEVGKGTTFRIFLPLRPPVEAAA